MNSENLKTKRMALFIVVKYGRVPNREQNVILSGLQSRFKTFQYFFMTVLRIYGTPKSLQSKRKYSFFFWGGGGEEFFFLMLLKLKIYICSLRHL